MLLMLASASVAQLPVQVVHHQHTSSAASASGHAHSNGSASGPAALPVPLSTPAGQRADAPPSRLQPGDATPMRHHPLHMHHQPSPSAPASTMPKDSESGSEVMSPFSFGSPAAHFDEPAAPSPTFFDECEEVEEEAEDEDTPRVRWIPYRCVIVVVRCRLCSAIVLACVYQPPYVCAVLHTM